MQKISYKKYFSNILWFTSTNLLTFVFLIPSVIDLFRDESSVAFGQEEGRKPKTENLLDGYLGHLVFLSIF